MKYKTLEFPTREEWLAWRHTGLGSSDASAIMNVSRFKTATQLKAEKMAPLTPEDTSNTYIKDRGNKIETIVRGILEEEHQTAYPARNIESSDFNFIRASLDGYSLATNTAIEIKLLSVFNPQKPNTETEGYKKWEAAKELGALPDEYYPQVQHQLMLTGADKFYFIGLKDVKGSGIIKENLAIVEVLPNRDYINHLAESEFRFWWDIVRRSAT